MLQRFTDRIRNVFGIDVRCLAVFRIVIATVILLDLALRSRFIAENYTDDGLLPRALVSAPDCYLSFQMLDGSFSFQIAHFAVAAIAGLMLLVGYRTKIATLSCWLMTVSLHARNTFLLDAGDDLLRSLLFWSLFLPLGHSYSIDARKKARRTGDVVLTPATVALLLQFACVYFFAGWFKSTPEWTSGIALEYALGQTVWVRPAGDALRQYPGLLSYMTTAVVWFELLAPLCLFIPLQTRRVRMFVLPAFWTFQLGLATTIQLHIFPLITAAATIPFLSSWIWPANENRDLETSTASTSGSGRASSKGAGRIVWCAMLMLLATATIGVQLANFGNSLFPTVERTASLIGWNPIWSMYATVSEFANALSVEATLADGSSIDLVESEATSGDRRRVLQLHKSYRFKYFLESTMGLGPEIPSRYLGWLVYRWNRTQPPERFVSRAQIISSKQRISPPGPVQISVVAEMAFRGPNATQPN